MSEQCMLLLAVDNLSPRRHLFEQVPSSCTSWVAAPKDYIESVMEDAVHLDLASDLHQRKVRLGAAREFQFLSRNDDRRETLKSIFFEVHIKADTWTSTAPWHMLET